MVFGGSPICPCVIKCNGQGPVLGVKPEDMDFGHVTLLKDQTKYFTLINESPIPAKLTASTVNHTRNHSFPLTQLFWFLVAEFGFYHKSN